MENKLTQLQAFKAMIKFLEIYYKNTSSDDVAVLLGGMQLLQNENTADPAAWQDWIECVNEVLKKNQ